MQYWIIFPRENVQHEIYYEIINTYVLVLVMLWLVMTYFIHVWFVFSLSTLVLYNKNIIILASIGVISLVWRLFVHDNCIL